MHFVYDHGAEALSVLIARRGGGGGGGGGTHGYGRKPEVRGQLDMCYMYVYACICAYVFLSRVRRGRLSLLARARGGRSRLLPWVKGANACVVCLSTPPPPPGGEPEPEPKLVICMYIHIYIYVFCTCIYAFRLWSQRGNFTVLGSTPVVSGGEGR